MKAKEVRVSLLKLPLLSIVELDSHVVRSKSEIHTKAPINNKPTQPQTKRFNKFLDRT
jgi:hypothetical protein